MQRVTEELQDHREYKDQLVKQVVLVELDQEEQLDQQDHKDQKVIVEQLEQVVYSQEEPLLHQLQLILLRMKNLFYKVQLIHIFVFVKEQPIKHIFNGITTEIYTPETMSMVQITIWETDSK